jgi:hypothetical protein
MTVQAFGAIAGRRYQTILLVVVVFALSIGTLFLYGDAYDLAVGAVQQHP